MKSREWENNNKVQRLRHLLLLLAVSGLAGVLVLSSCATGASVMEVPFGTEAVAGPFTVSTEKTGEGEFLLTLMSSAAEELSLDVRMKRTEIGFDYRGTNAAKNNPIVDAKFSVDGGRTSLAGGVRRDISIRLTNTHQVNRYFNTKVTIYIKGVDTKWRLGIPISDSELFEDIEFLRQLNKTDYWHPRIIEENRQKYLDRIGE